MNKSTFESRQSNPFATRWVRPGAMRYRFDAGMNAGQLVDALRENGWRGAIVGPHGSGKSTLLFDLIPAVEQKGISVERISLHDGQRRLPPGLLRQIRRACKTVLAADKNHSRNPQVLLVVDGYEQLGWWSRRRLAMSCRAHGCGLLITAHCVSTIGQIPLLFRTAPDLAAVQYLVDHVLPTHGGAIDAADVAAAFEMHDGNVRETLFSLYDLFEQRRREALRTEVVGL